MFFLKKALVSLLLPPAGPILAALFGLWLARRRPRAGYLITVACLLGLLVLSLPWCSQKLLSGLEHFQPVSTSALADCQAIVILGAGIRQAAPEYGDDTVNDAGLERLRYGARLARQTGLPVAVTGGVVFAGQAEGVVMREALATDFGIQPRWVESTSRTTAENAANLAPLLKEAGITHVALVTHAWHMERAKRLFERQGMTVIPAPTVWSTAAGHPGAALLPGTSALRGSAIALHEWLGLWIDTIFNAQ